MADQFQIETESVEKKSKFESKLTFNTSVVEKIAAIATRDIEGVIETKGGAISGFIGNQTTSGVSADVGEKQTAIDITIVLEYGYNAPEVFNQIKNNVTERVNEMTGLEVVEVNVRIVDVMTRQEYLQKTQGNKEDMGLK